jgi:hypothetical protein
LFAITIVFVVSAAPPSYSDPLSIVTTKGNYQIDEKIVILGTLPDTSVPGLPNLSVYDKQGTKCLTTIRVTKVDNFFVSRSIAMEKQCSKTGTFTVLGQINNLTTSTTFSVLDIETRQQEYNPYDDLRNLVNKEQAKIEEELEKFPQSQGSNNYEVQEIYLKALEERSHFLNFFTTDNKEEAKKHAIQMLGHFAKIHDKIENEFIENVQINKISQLNAEYYRLQQLNERITELAIKNKCDLSEKIEKVNELMAMTKNAIDISNTQGAELLLKNVSKTIDSARVEMYQSVTHSRPG